MPEVRKEHQYTKDGVTCYWHEMEHPGEGSRTLEQIFDIYLNQYNWSKFIRPGSTVIDIGGHSGDTAIPMQFLARGTVLSVEPNPYIRPYLELTCNKNPHLGKFVVAAEAVTTIDIDAVEICDHRNAMCNGGLIDDSWSPELKARMIGMTGNKVTVKGLTLEHLLSKYLTPAEINNISFLKTDTEGHDVSILESSVGLIDRIRPIIFTEWFFAYTPAESKRLFDVIKKIGYTAFNPVTLQPADINHHIEDLLLIHNSKINNYL
ncbi:MAG TPA: FkbM family methyltransferase [Methanosarcina sp.]|nr:FkbM family methyltransferase [Methanosarcina sp.]